MPELVAIYFAGVMIGLICTTLFIYYLRWRRTGEAYLTLQDNLRKVGLYWSDHRDRLVEWNQEASAQEDTKTGRSLTIAGLMLSALSWPGVLFFLIIIASVVFLARSRTEKGIFSSQLTRDPDLSPAQVQSIIEGIVPQTQIVRAEQTT